MNENTTLNALICRHARNLLLAQGWPAREALLAGVHLHGLAADRLVNQGSGPIGLTAGECIDSARHCFNEWVRSPNKNAN